MTHLPAADTLDLLKSYFMSPERDSVVSWEIRGRTRSRKIRRATRPATGQVQHRDRKPIAGDFSDADSERVLDAMADALLEPLAVQAARDDDEAEWLVSQQGRL